MSENSAKERSTDLESHNPLQHNDSSHLGELNLQDVRKLKALSTLLGPTGADLFPAPHKRQEKMANPAPLGLCAFALTTFVLSLINVTARGVTTPNIVVGLAMWYGGLVQLIAGVLEIFRQNTFGATALSSYGGFWLSFGAIFIPWFNIESAYTSKVELTNAIGFYLFGWFIFTFLLLICTLKSTVAFFLLFFSLDLAFLMLSIGYIYQEQAHLIRAGGAFGLVAAFMAWYNALAGMADTHNSFFKIRTLPFPWSEAGRQSSKED